MNAQKTHNQVASGGAVNDPVIEVLRLRGSVAELHNGRMLYSVMFRVFGLSNERIGIQANVWLYLWLADHPELRMHRKKLTRLPRMTDQALLTFECEVV